MVLAILRGRVKTRGNAAPGGIIRCALLVLSVSIAATSVGQTGPAPPHISPAATPLTPANIAAPSLHTAGAPVAIITGGSAVVLRSTGSSGTLAWRTEPPEAIKYCQPIQILGEPALLFVWPGHPQVAVLLIATNGAVITTDRFVIPADGVIPIVDPTPPIVDPVPPIVDPVPPIVDPPLPAITEVLLLFESDVPDDQEAVRLAAKQAKVRLDRSWEKLLRDKGISVLRQDKDRLEAKYQPLVENLKGPLPRVLFLDADGGVVADEPQAATVEGLTQLVKEKTK